MGQNTIEISIKGKRFTVPTVEINGWTVFTRGKWLKIAAIHDEALTEGELEDPESFVQRIRENRSNGFRADIFTFGQKLPSTSPRFDYKLEWYSLAVIPITSYLDWLEKRAEHDVRSAVKKAKRLGVVVKVAEFDAQFVEGIVRINNESPIRQGRPFWHYGKDFDTVRRENGTYLERSTFLGAYYGDELIGYIKLVYVGQEAIPLQIIGKIAHLNKKPMNALIAKAVEICEQKGMSFLSYGWYRDPNSSLAEFKRRNGFERVLLPRYYIPLTLKGYIALKLKLHHGPTDMIPKPIFTWLRNLRNAWYSKKAKAPKK